MRVRVNIVLILPRLNFVNEVDLTALGSFHIFSIHALLLFGFLTCR